MSEVQQHVSSTESHIIVSDAAKRHLLQYLNKEQVYRGVRLSVKKTGCSGLSYVIDYLTNFDEKDLVEPLSAVYNLYIDKLSYPFIKGVYIDYVTEGLISKLVFKNPNQTGQCGCGESFTVDDI